MKQKRYTEEMGYSAHRAGTDTAAGKVTRLVLWADGGCRHQGVKIGCYAGLDVSLEMTSVCIVAADGKVLCEGKAPSEPEGVIAFLAAAGVVFERVGLEAGALSEWLAAALKKEGFPVVWTCCGKEEGS